METKDDGGPVGSSSLAEGASLSTLPWPPPGLERIQGDLYVAVRWLGSGAFLILPLLWAVVGEQDPWSLGFLGNTLWLVFLLAIMGVPIVVGGYVVLGRLLRRSSKALGRGYQARVVALVAADHRHDAGFLLQGAREYRVLTPATRRRLASNRILVGGLLLVSALWVSLGFGASVVLAARGVLTPWGMVITTGAPSLVAAAIAVIAYAWEEGILRRCRKRWFGRGRSRDLVREEIRAWQTAMAELAPAVVAPKQLPEGGGRARTALRASYVGLGAATLVAFVPVFTLVFSAAIIPVLARIAVPRMDEAVTQLAAAEPLRAYALEPDTSITAAEAGGILHTLSFVGRPYQATEGVLPPPRAYPDPWFPQDSAAPPAPGMAGLAESLVDDLGRPIPADRLAYLERVAGHPAHAELARLARAPALDITAVRWSLPLPSDVTLAELAMPTVGVVREAAYAHLARAAVAASRGRVAAADTIIREVLSAGLLLADESPSVLDNLIGLALVQQAGAALQALYTNTGHPAAAELAWGVAAAARSVERARATLVDDLEARIRAMPDDALDTTFVRGMRWEYVGLLNTLGPCMNLRRVVFGPDPEYRSWLERVESGLVRYPGEAELFEAARGGLLGQDTDDAPTLATRLLALTMGRSDQPGSCARVLGEAVGY